ncbi:uncharacterized protein LOC131466836 [Solea solea]|uniref:uncharacterized protein LOC131466836 n=1 Tax=Solea solea TaxID=90069 RepID=UPI00272C6022|nr:uncharacterized protein LOC131466836 [Solea solea]
MAKEKEKTDGLAPPQTRLLQSKKRECPSEEIPQTDGVQAYLHRQDTKENTTKVVAMPLQCPQSPIRECPLMSNKQDQVEVQSCITKQNESTEEKHTEETSKSLKHVTIKDFEEQDVPTATWVSIASDLEGCRVHTDNETSKSGMKKESPQEEDIRSPFQTCTNQLKVLLPVSEEGDGSSTMTLVEQLGVTEDSQCNMERNYETKEEPCNTYVADGKEITKETAAGLPARKKRRMGMCGLTEKERSHFLQTRKLLIGQSGAESVEKEISKNISDDVAQEEFTSSVFIPPSTSPISKDCVTEQGVAEINSQSSHSGNNDRAETEVHNTVTTSDGSSDVCYPGSEGKSCEAEGGTKPGPEQPDEAKSESPAQDEVVENLVNRDQLEIWQSTTESMTKTPEKQRKDEEEKFTNADCSAAISFYTNPTQNEESGKMEDSESVSLLVHRVNQTRDESEEKDETEAQGTSFTVTHAGGVNGGSVELCEAAVTPTGTERKDICCPEEAPRRPTVNTVHTEKRDTSDLFGSGCLDDVSDSQLNTIILTEEDVMESKKTPDSADFKDATDLICGLIRELSSLNHKVMATHRELENLRRGNKTSRSSLG